MTILDASTQRMHFNVTLKMHPIVRHLIFANLNWMNWCLYSLPTHCTERRRGRRLLSACNPKGSRKKKNVIFFKTDKISPAEVPWSFA